MFGGASTASDKVDAVFLYISALTIAFLIFITGLMIYFVVRYHRSRGGKPEDIHSHALLETLWTVVPLALFLTMFYYGWTNYRYLREVPRDAMVIQVTGRQWAWSFTYPNGRQTSELYVAINRPIRLDLKSLDVLHGFYIPAFRVKADVVPGKNNYTWFQATQKGEFDIECTVMCGVSHSYMLSKVHVIPEVDFSRWYFGDSADAPVLSQADTTPEPGRGERVFKLKGCVSCHSTDGTKLVGPTWKDLFGSKVTVLADGKESTVTADEDYIRRSIHHPPQEVVKGFAPQMPKTELKDRDVADLIAYIKSLSRTTVAQ
jgi:cytochrome c oxidase subunit 2